MVAGDWHWFDFVRRANAQQDVVNSLQNVNQYRTIAEIAAHGEDLGPRSMWDFIHPRRLHEAYRAR